MTHGHNSLKDVTIFERWRLESPGRIDNRNAGRVTTSVVIGYDEGVAIQ